MNQPKKSKFADEDASYLAARESFANEIGVHNLWEIIDQFGLYAGPQTLATRLAMFELVSRTRGR